MSDCSYFSDLSRSAARFTRLAVLAILAGGLFAGTASAQQPSVTVQTILSDFTYGTGSPTGPLVRGQDGNFYGYSFAGGAHNAGTILRITPAGAITTLVTFDATSGEYPSALIAGLDGNLYSLTSGNTPTVFKLTPAGERTTLLTVNSPSVPSPQTITQGSDGNFYGTAYSSGSYGSIYKMTPAGEFTILTAFDGTNGFYPGGSLVEGRDGNFYGSTNSSGNSTVFKVTPAGKLTTLAVIANPSGFFGSLDTLAIDSTGNLYGAGFLGTGTLGTIFRVSPTGEVKSLADFNGASGSEPQYLSVGRDGNIYGCWNSSSSTYPGGLVFKMSPTGEVTVMGSGSSGLIQTEDGDFFGATEYSTADHRYGSFFKISTVYLPSIMSAASASGSTNQPFTYQIVASNSPTSYTATGLPIGVTVDPVTGLISGTPVDEATYNATIAATNAAGTVKASLALSFTSLQSLAPTINSTAAATAEIGFPFQYAISATNTPTSYAVVGLPPGLSIDAASGLITGSPTQQGVYNASLIATNGFGSGTAGLTVTITFPPSNIQAVDILSPPTNINIVSGEVIDLAVAVEATPGMLSSTAFSVIDAAGNVIPLGSSTAPRDHKTWMPGTLGDFLLSATATDTNGVKAVAQIPIHVIEGTSPPVSQLLSSLDGKTFAAGSTIPLVGLASDADGNPLSNVQFFVNGMPLTTTRASSDASKGQIRPQDALVASFAQSNLTLGKMEGDSLLTFTGTDSRGVTSVSSGVTIHAAVTTDSNALACTLTEPFGQLQLKRGESAPVAASAAESGRSISQVEFFLNGASAGKVTAAPYKLEIPMQQVGTFALTAIATDDQDVSQVSAPVVIAVAEPPTVTIAAKGRSEALEGGGAAKLEVMRSGDTTAPLTVRFKIVGAVQEGVDYTASATRKVTIPAGATSAKIKIKSVDDSSHESERVAKVKLLPSSDGSYTLGSDTVGKIEIIDND